MFATVCARGMIRLKVGRACQLGIYVTQTYKTCEINCALHLRVLVHYQLSETIMRQYFSLVFNSVIYSCYWVHTFPVGTLLSVNRVID